MRLLLVEDEPSLAVLLERYLARAGYEVVCHARGAAALAVWDATFVAAVVDLGLPDMPGEQLVDLMLARHRAPVLISSGTPVDPARFGAEAVVEVLHKPYLPGELLAVLSRLAAAGATVGEGKMGLESGT